MPRKNPLTAPLGKIKDTALDAIKDPKGTAEKVVDQARGTASLGRSLAGGVVGQVAGQVASRVPKRRGTSQTSTPPAPTVRPVPSEEPRPHGDPLQPATKAPAKKAPAAK